MKIAQRLAVLTVLLVLGAPAVAGAGNVPDLPVCDQAAFEASVDVSAKPTWQRVWVKNASFLVPYNSKWKLGGKQLTRLHKEKEDRASGSYNFGQALVSPLGACESYREYEVDFIRGSTYKPEFSPYEARVEKIGPHVVVIYRVTGDTDCPGEHAVTVHNGYVVKVAKACSAVDVDVKKVISSLK